MGGYCNCSFPKHFRNIDGSTKCLVCHKDIQEQQLKDSELAYKLLLNTEENESSKEQYLREWFQEALKEIKAKDQTIKQLEDALRDLSEALAWYAKDIDGFYDERGAGVARETLQKHSELLSKINEEGNK
jgi:membrane-bound lytic murein transglycosylase B